MYVDASAIVAIITGEADGEELLEKIERSNSPFTSVVTKVEAALAIGRAMGNVGEAAKLVDVFLNQLSVRTDGVPPELYLPIMEAASRYGKGTGHPSKLNFGDCFSYAIAKREGVALLYKGDDFSKTDLA